jgi:4-hydroxy-tetrahydrodipicolinate reductase
MILIFAYIRQDKEVMKKIKIILAGATGWVGSYLAKTIHESNDLELVGAIAADNLERMLGNVIQVSNLTVPISDLHTALQIPADVFIDFTHPSVAKHHILTAINQGLYVIIGTSGLTETDYVDIEQAALQKNVGVIAAGNFSITAVLMQRFAAEAARFIASWEIIDYASAAKPDAPSGTARALAQRLSEIRAPHITRTIDQTLGSKEARGANIQNTQIHSIRLPSYTLSTEIIFGMPHEKLIIRHDSDDSPHPYAAGVLLAARNVQKYHGLIRGLDRILADAR